MCNIELSFSHMYNSVWEIVPKHLTSIVDLAVNYIQHNFEFSESNKNY